MATSSSAPTIWDGNHSMLYDINTSNAARKLLADIPMKDMGFVFQNDAKPRFSYGEDDDNNPVLYRRDDASGDWRKVDRATARRRFHPFAFTPDDGAVYAWHSDRRRTRTRWCAKTCEPASARCVAQDPLGSIEHGANSAPARASRSPSPA